ncbi:unnamed protein product [Allacma fusca]|uniref:L-xylulose reductase n=1 Tax=Allacma fusca TaxID=39272 RepID=A0A8J2L3G4_9HEXA|nr:unnamed protein product [Allacma fusca]
MENVYDFTGKRVLVTGGGRGIGLGIVKKFVQLNATVIVLDIDDTLLENLAINYPTVIRVKVDLRSWDDTKKAVESVLPINHLVNNVGFPNTPNFPNLSEDDVNFIFDLNFKSYLNVGQVVAKDMLKNKIENATIVNISSAADNMHLCNGGGTAIYSCSKAAVTTLTKVMAKELSPFGIRVNSIRPSATNTELQRGLPEEFHNLMMKPLLTRHLHNRLIETDEIADGVIFLSSQMSTMITGSSLTIDGGNYIPVIIYYGTLM